MPHFGNRLDRRFHGSLHGTGHSPQRKPACYSPIGVLHLEPCPMLPHDQMRRHVRVMTRATTPYRASASLHMPA